MTQNAMPGSAVPGSASPGSGSSISIVITYKVVTESLGLTDSVVLQTAVSKVVTEALGLTEAVSKGEAKVKVVTESLGMTETLVTIVVYIFTSPTEARSFMAATTRENDADRPDFRSQFVTVSDAPGAEKRAFINVARDVRQLLSEGVVRAEFWFYFEDDPAGADVTIAPIDEEWSEATVTHNNQPDVRAAEAVTEAKTEAGWHSIDITTMVAQSLKKTEAGDKPWFGIRLTTDSATDLRLYSDNAQDDRRPYLKIEPNIAPYAPSGLSPSSGKFVSSITPKFIGDFNDANGDDTITGIELLVDTDETFETPLYDSGQVTHDSSMFDSADPPADAAAWPTLYEDDDPSAPVDGYFFTLGYRDNHGAWSPTSVVANFRIMGKPALVISTAAGNSSTPIPTIDFTMSDITRREIVVEDRTFMDQPWEEVYREPANPSTSLTFANPVSVPHEVGVTRRFTVRGWDSKDRASLPGDPAYSEDTVELTRTV
jgi:hypothetical protein